MAICTIYAYFSEGQNTVIKLLVLLKYNRGNSLTFWEEKDVPIFKNVFLLGRNDCFSWDGGLILSLKKVKIVGFSCMLVIDFTIS